MKEQTTGEYDGMLADLEAEQEKVRVLRDALELITPQLRSWVVYAEATGQGNPDRVRAGNIRIDQAIAALAATAEPGPHCASCGTTDRSSTTTYHRHQHETLCNGCHPDQEPGADD